MPDLHRSHSLLLPIVYEKRRSERRSMKHIFIYRGKSTADFGVAISGQDTWKTAAPAFERVSVPGRNGDLILDTQRYENVPVTYHCLIARDFPINYAGFVDHLFSSIGYGRLEDSYHPEVFRMAIPEGALEPAMHAMNRHGEFSVTFSCKPQAYLKSGYQPIGFTSSGTLHNPTLQEARPLIRVYGIGQFQIGSYPVRVKSCDGYVDIDCELEDAFKGLENCNGDIELLEDFPRLGPGSNSITLGTGIIKLEITPRWWRL